MGSAALYHLARRGKRVLGLERFDVPNDMGSSHGVTRIIRLAYFEHPDYVPLLRRATSSGASSRPRRASSFSTSPASWKRGSASTRARSARAPTTASRTRPSTAASSAALIRRSACRRSCRSSSSRTAASSSPSAASSRTSTGRSRAAPSSALASACWSGSETENGVRVRTDRGVVEADRLVLTAGAWSQDVARLPPGLAAALRQAVAWLQPTRARALHTERFPCSTSYSTASTSTAFRSFGVPGFKSAATTTSARAAIPTRSRASRPSQDEPPLRAFAERYFPDGAGSTMALKTCLFEPSPDEHFLIDRHPETELAVVGAGFSGHGFKFCSVVGEILADLALDGRPATTSTSCAWLASRRCLIGNWRAVGGALDQAVRRTQTSCRLDACATREGGDPAQCRGRRPARVNFDHASSRPYPFVTRAGGTGRRGGFRSRWASALGGSSPPARTARPARATGPKAAALRPRRCPESTDPSSPCSGRVAACE